MALFNSTVRPSQQASDLGSQRGRLLQSVFPSLPTPAGANSPAAPNPADRTRAQAPTQQSAATRAAQAVQVHLAANPLKPVTAPVKSTRENSQLTQSAGTINTGYVNSAAAQGYNNVTPPNIFRGMRDSTRGSAEGQLVGDFSYLNPGAFTNARDPNRTRESFYNNVFTPNTAQQRANLFAPPAPAPGQQVGVPVNTFPPRNQFLNFLFPR